MSSKLFLRIFLWGFLLWLLGYILGIIFFFLLPASLIGWCIMPIGIFFTAIILHRKFNNLDNKSYFLMGVLWSVQAVMLDYLLLVKVFNPTGGYYKLDVYLYYFITLVLPVLYSYMKRVEKK